MKYQIDHDLHIHSYISGCAGHDPRQTKEAILAYGLTRGLGLLNIADHIWDRKVVPAKVTDEASSWSWLSAGQDFEKARELLPLPQSPKCNFLFGIEVDMDCMGNIAVSREEFDSFDFMVFAPGHLHLNGFTCDYAKFGRSAVEFKELYQERLFQLLNMDLPFRKCGLAHFTCCLDCEDGPVKAFELFTDEEYREIFRLVAERGMAVELNVDPYLYSPDEIESILRPFRIAKAMGCKFYLGGDAHTPEQFALAIEKFEWLIDLLELTEEDKCDFVKEHLAKSYK